jgi:hypothetical protein
MKSAEKRRSAAVETQLKAMFEAVCRGPAPLHLLALVERLDGRGRVTPH